jgi:hypothetical protein
MARSRGADRATDHWPNRKHGIPFLILIFLMSVSRSLPGESRFAPCRPKALFGGMVPFKAAESKVAKNSKRPAVSIRAEN